MHTRQDSWYSLGDVRSEDVDARALRISHTLGGLDIACAERWTRIRVSLEGVPAERHSWALDPTTEERRDWVAPASVPGAPETVTRTGTRRYAVATDRVEGLANPHEDTRGLLSRHWVADRRVIEGLGALEIARCRDGIAFEVHLAPEAQVYGLGERTGALDKRGRTWRMWNTDEPEHLPNTDPLYQSIPVAYIVDATGVTTIFSDTPATQYFDAGESMNDRLMIEAFDSQVALYVRHDATLREAVAAYSTLTGFMPLPPEWALGYQQCRYSYYPADRVLEIARELRRRHIPADTLVLDIHYMDGYRVFTWDTSRFPDPQGLIDDLHGLGFRVVTIVDPGVKIDSDWEIYRDGLARGVYLRTADGAPYCGAVWPGPAVFPDFSSEGARDWWAGHLANFLESGVDGVWNDMNEPADFLGDGDYRPEFTVPDTLIADNDGDSRSMARVHNIYASGMNEATRRAVADARPEARGFVLTRAGYAGNQRNAAVWTGDNHSWWEHLAGMVPMLLNLSLSGVPFCGADVGGFQGNASPELYARWIAAAAFTPFFRGHSALNTIDHEPWSFGDEALDVAREMIGLRYRLLPYLYTLFEEASRTGAPVMRPLVLEFPDDPEAAARADAFMLGASLLVAPVREPAVRERAVYLPEGVWYDAWTGARIDAGRGGARVVADAPLSRIPLYLRGGHIIPWETLRMHTGEAGDGVLRLLVAPDADGNASGDLYADAGEGWEYLAGQAARVQVTAEGRHVTLTCDGSYRHTRWDAVSATRLDGETAAVAILTGTAGGKRPPKANLVDDEPVTLKMKK